MRVSAPGREAKVAWRKSEDDEGGEAMRQRPKWQVRELAPCRWLARVTVGVMGGKRVQKAKTFGSRKEADAWALQMVGQREAGTLVLPTT